MNFKKEVYCAVLKETDNDIYVIQMVKKETWEAEQLLDEEDEFIDCLDHFKLKGYQFDSSGMLGDSCIDMITRDDEADVNPENLKEDLINEGYIVNEDFASYMEESTKGFFEKT